jgi:ParB family chromosome partitioning protein
MANFRKRPLSPHRVAEVQNAASTAPLVDAGSRVLQDSTQMQLNTRSAPQAAANVGASQGAKASYQVGTIYQIPLSEIRSNPFNPRAVYTSAAVDAMASSLLSGGQRVSATGYVGDDGQVVLIEGETRLRGARVAGLSTLRVEIRPRPGSDRELYEEARAANVERRDQSPLDDAIKWKELLAKKIYPTQSALAKALRVGEDHVSRTLSLASMPLRIVHAVADHPDLLSHKMLNAVREYWAIKGDDDTHELILEVAKHGMGYRDVVNRRKAAEVGPVKRTRALRETLSYKGAKGELKSFADEGRLELVLKGLNQEASSEISAKILALFSKS